MNLLRFLFTRQFQVRRIGDEIWIPETRASPMLAWKSIHLSHLGINLCRPAATFYIDSQQSTLHLANAAITCAYGIPHHQIPLNDQTQPSIPKDHD